jgi:kynureninase
VERVYEEGATSSGRAWRPALPRRAGRSRRWWSRYDRGSGRIELSIEAGIDAIRAKSVALTEYAIELADTAVAPLGVSVDSPRGPCPGRSHLALVQREARTLTAALAVHRVISDFRAPDVIRSGLSSLRRTFADVLAGVGALGALLLE